MTSWTCTLPGYFPPSPNSVGEKVHWTVRKRIKQAAFEYLCISGGLDAPAFDGPVRIKITRRYSGRHKAMDEDNLTAACKPLIDALRRPKGKETGRRLGIIEDDTPALMELVVTQERANVTETVIEVEAVS